MLADEFDAFLIDLDGVVWVGDVPLPGSVDALARLRAAGKSLRFVTNDPRPTRAEVAHRLRRVGVAAEVDEVVTSAWATARHLRRERISPVHVLGSSGLLAELHEAGIEVSAAGREGAAAVVVGCDEALGYRDLQRATRVLSGGAAFIATNPDGWFPGLEGRLPATGAIVAALTAATGRRPRLIGKPATPIFAAALAGLPGGQRVAMVGDRLETDVRGAQRAGLAAILVALASVPGPDAVVPGLPALLEPGRATVPGRVVADRVEAGVAAVVMDETGRILLGRRADNGLWGLPSGHVEVGESAAEAALREVAEEAGLDVVVRRLIGVYSDPASQVFAYPDGAAVQFVTCCFLCNLAPGSEPRADGVETVEAAFFPPDRLPEGLLPMHPRWLEDALAAREAAFVR